MKQTNQPQKAILLVEGRCDVEFLKALLPQLLPKPKIPVLTPTECGAHKDDIKAVFMLLPELITDLKDQRIERLGIVVDADYTDRNGGFAARWKEFTAILRKKDKDYIISPPPDQAYTGSIFQHDCGYPPVGLWIMPNHNANHKEGDGMLEDFIKRAVYQGQQQELLEKARGCVDQLPKNLKLFSDFHQTKAEVYTWLAWQEQPGQSLAKLFPEESKFPQSSQPSQPSQPLIDLKSEGIKGFKGWFAKNL
jgi:hypothetical protein